MTSTRHLLALGFGYTARRLAARCLAAGWTVTGTSRTRQGADAVCANGARGLVFDGAGRSAEVSAAIGAATHVLLSIPPGSEGDPVLAWHGRDLAGATGLEALVYLSTVGVYGDRGGSWVDEDTAPAPRAERSRQRLAAEQAWLDLATRSGRRVVVLRLPGIYGPGRSAIDALRQGTARRIVKVGQVFNRAHVDDIASAALMALTRPTDRRVFNVADDEPAPPQDVIEHAARLIGAPVPAAVAIEAAGLSPMAASFYAESKRVSNRRMKDELGVVLAYPTYREGLASIAAER